MKNGVGFCFFLSHFIANAASEVLAVLREYSIRKPVRYIVQYVRCKFVELTKLATWNLIDSLVPNIIIYTLYHTYILEDTIMILNSYV